MTDQQTPKSQIEMTLSSSTIRLENGTGAVTASITNTGAAAQRVVLRVFGGTFIAPPKAQAGEGGSGPVTEPTPHAPGTPAPEETPDPAGWATIEESLRTIPAGATEQYSVTFTAGPAPGGTYAVKLNAYSADEPPESKSGQTLALELVVPARPAKPKSRKFPWWIAAAAGLVAVVAAVAFFLWPRNTEVPALAGSTLVQAQEALAKAGLGGKFNPVESSETPDVVLRQDPAAGARVEPGSVVTLDFAVVQTVVVPNVFNQPAGAARSGLEDSGLKVVLNPASSCTINEAGCKVRGQLPKAGETVPVGSTVMLTIGNLTFTFNPPLNVCKIVFCPTLEAKDLGKILQR